MGKENEGTNVEEVIADTKPVAESINTEEQTVEQTGDNVEGTDANKRIPYDRFKAKVDEANALKARLDEIEQAQEEDKRKELVEQNEYKTLYEQALEQTAQAKQEALAIKKSALLTQAGYGEEQTKMLAKLVDGETDEELAESIKLVIATIPAQDNYADPSAFNGAKAKPEKVDGEEVGRSAVSRVLHKIRL